MFLHPQFDPLKTLQGGTAACSLLGILGAQNRLSVAPKQVVRALGTANVKSVAPNLDLEGHCQVHSDAPIRYSSREARAMLPGASRE